MTDLAALIAQVEALDAEAKPGPWPTPKEVGDPYDPRIPVDHEGCEVWPWRWEDDMVFAYAMRSAAPVLAAALKDAIETIRDIEDPCRHHKQETLECPAFCFDPAEEVARAFLERHET